MNNTACFLADHNLAQVASFRTFCAGGSKKGPCTGGPQKWNLNDTTSNLLLDLYSDSGAGFFVKIDDAWTLKGITSAGPLNPLGGCDAERYTVFTDVYKFHEWIQGIIDGKNTTEEIKVWWSISILLKALQNTLKSLFLDSSVWHWKIVRTTQPVMINEKNKMQIRRRILLHQKKSRNPHFTVTSSEKSARNSWKSAVRNI